MSGRPHRAEGVLHRSCKNGIHRSHHRSGACHGAVEGVAPHLRIGFLKAPESRFIPERGLLQSVHIVCIVREEHGFHRSRPAVDAPHPVAEAAEHKAVFNGLDALRRLRRLLEHVGKADELMREVSGRKTFPF